MNYLNYGSGFGFGGMMGGGYGAPVFGSLIILVVIWSLLWKGLALWRAANRGEKWWFIAFLIINTLGILEIIYLFAITGAKLSYFTSKITRNGHNH